MNQFVFISSLKTANRDTLNQNRVTSQIKRSRQIMIYKFTYEQKVRWSLIWYIFEQSSLLKGTYNFVVGTPHQIENIKDDKNDKSFVIFHSARSDRNPNVNFTNTIWHLKISIHYVIYIPKNLHISANGGLNITLNFRFH